MPEIKQMNNKRSARFLFVADRAIDR